MDGNQFHQETRIVSIVIPCLNGAITLPRLVTALEQQRLPEGFEKEVIVVDNGSTDGTLDLLATLSAKVIRESRRGPGSARNTGIRAARGEIILLLDADTRPVHSDLILEHLNTLNQSEAIGIAGGSISPDPEQRGWIAFADNAASYFNWHWGLSPKYFTFQPTANLAFRRNLLDLVGLFREDLLWLEDFEWNTRVREKGYQIYFNPRAGVYHRGRATLRNALKHLYTWGLNVRKVYLPGRPEKRWFWKDNPLLFCLNIPFRVLLLTYITLKRWVGFYPLKTLFLIPVFFLLWFSWGLGVMMGGVQRETTPK
jgi:glycosyltransferase involved in cell wall biosynthesis